MARSIAEIAADFNCLSARDFDLWNENADGIERLYQLTEELLESKQPKLAADLMFRFIERLNGADLGSPGPLVHTLEKLPGYEEQLFESVERKPTPLSVWMINRILNATAESEKSQLIDILNKTLLHSLASDETQQWAKEFLQYQAEA